MNITVYCGSNPGADPRFAEAARELGTWIGASGHCLVYGGSSVGLMGAVSRAALDAGGRVEGVEPQFFIDAGVAQHDLTELHVVETMGHRKAMMIELGDAFVAGGRVEGVEPQFFIDAGVAQHDLTELHVVETMGHRKAMMIELGDAFVALPGGMGTLEEISEVMSQIRLRMGPARCHLLNLGGFYDPLAELLRAMVGQGFLDDYELDRICFPASVGELEALLAEDAADLAVTGGRRPQTPYCPEALPGNRG